MSRSRCIAFVMPILMASATLAVPRSDAAAEPQVYILAVANADSYDRDLPVLRYAHDDLRRFTQAMKQVGMVPPSHIIELQEATIQGLRLGFATVGAKLAATSGAVGNKFIFYYTGHSDAEGLHLADGRFAKDELRQLISTVPSSARIAFLDGCYSGALAAKGIKPAGDFTVPQAEFDEPSGSVYFAATSGNDVAFEVEELAGSLFTHHLVEGLLGGADTNHDGIVTIDELYQHVYRQMRTQALALPGASPQKPEYSLDLHGRGALVMTYVAKNTVPTALAADLEGELSLSAEGGLTTLHLALSDHAAAQILLVPGTYDVELRKGETLGRGTLVVRPGEKARLAASDLHFARASNLDVVAKGQRPLPRYAAAVGVQASSYTRPGPNAEVSARTGAIRVESTAWRLTAVAGGHINDLWYHEQTGKSASINGLLAGQGSVFSSYGLPGQQWTLLVGGGADYTWLHWTEEARTRRSFGSFLPLVALGFGTDFTVASGLTWELSFRREFPFAKDPSTGDMLAFGANVFGIGAAW